MLAETTDVNLSSMSRRRDLEPPVIWLALEEDVHLSDELKPKE